MANRRPIRQKEIFNPERIMSHMLKDYVEGNLDDYNFLFRASVVSVDHIGGQLEVDPPNPKNSIKARVITNARDKDLAVEDLPVFWPLFSHDVLPVKEGEHIYVIYEDANNKSHGLWMGRIPEPNSVESDNLILGSKKYQNDPNNNFSSVGLEKSVQDSDIDPGSLPISDEFSVENVNDFTPRVGDRVIKGSNDTLIVLGRDRPQTTGSFGEKSQAGTIDIVTGRSSNGLDLSLDKSRVYISSKSDVDNNFKVSIGNPTSGPSAAIAIKSDEIRIIARNGMKLVVEGGDLVIDGANISIGDKAQESAVLGDTLKDLLGQILDAIATLTVATGVGPSGPPINAAQFEAFKPLIDTALSKTVKIKL